jgi:hypothetical protein
MPHGKESWMTTAVAVPETADIAEVKAQLATRNLVPLELAGTDVGALEVEHLIGRLEHGIPA